MRPVVIFDLADDWTPRNIAEAAHVAAAPADGQRAPRFSSELRFARDPLADPLWDPGLEMLMDTVFGLE